jgi:hypothetical protein
VRQVVRPVPAPVDHVMQRSPCAREQVRPGPGATRRWSEPDGVGEQIRDPNQVLGEAVDVEPAGTAISSAILLLGDRFHLLDGDAQQVAESISRAPRFGACRRRQQ